MRFWRTFLYQHVCRCTHNVEHDSDIFYDVSVCYRQWYWRCGAFYGFLIARPAQRNESIHYVPQDRSKTARKKERACGRFRTSEPPANPHYSNKKATSLSADGFWSEWRESNSRPLEPHSSALPNCATPGCLLVVHQRRCLLYREVIEMSTENLWFFVFNKNIFNNIKNNGHYIYKESVFSLL